MEDPLFGPVLSFGIGGPLTELLGDRSYRIPPLADHDAQDMVREIKASPLLFGYRGSEIVDVEEIERLVRQVAQLQHDLPQVRALQLPLSWRAPRASPCSVPTCGSSRSRTRGRTGSSRSASARCRGTRCPD